MTPSPSDLAGEVLLTRFISMPLIRSFAFQDYRRLRSGQQSHGNERGNHTQHNTAKQHARENVPVRQDHGVEIDAADGECNGYPKKESENCARGTEQCRFASEERSGKGGRSTESFHDGEVLATVENGTGQGGEN